MKILFISKGYLPDYQSDMILHGFISLFGDDVVDVNQCWYMYKDLKNKHWAEIVPENGKAYGRGFTTTGLFENRNLDRSQIDQRIYNKEFDLIVFGSVRRFTQYLNLVLDCYPKEKIIFIDGQDQTDIDYNLVNKGFYFKRELIIDNKNLFPINFCIPEEKIFNGEVLKTVDIASIIPGVFKTYIYEHEQDYYQGYRDAYFGITHKKGGWDCLRHYEIIMNKCLPYFENIDMCPPKTMMKFPKQLCLNANNLIKQNKFDLRIYWEIVDEMHQYLKENLTTKNIAKYLLEIVL